MSFLKAQTHSQKSLRTIQPRQKEKLYASFLNQTNQTSNNKDPPTNIDNCEITTIIKEKDKQITELMKQIEKMKKECDKNQIQYMKLEQRMSTSPTNAKVNKFSNVNTSTNFPLYSEVVKKWETFGLDDIINNFIDFEEEPEIMFQLIQEMFFLCGKFIKEICEEKYNQISSILNLPNNQDTHKNLENYTKPIFQEHLKNIFNTEEKEFFEKFIEKYKSFFNDNIDNKHLDNFTEMIGNKSFENMIVNIKDIILFCEFNVPRLELKIEEDPKKRQIEIINTKNNPPIQKSEMIIVNNIEDKFLNNVMILLKPPMLNGYIFNKNFKTIVIPYNIDTPTTLLTNTYSNCSSNYNILNNIQKENLSNKHSFVCNSIGNQIMISTSPLFRTSLSPNGEEENERCLTDNTNGDNGRIMYLNNQKIVSRKLDFSKIQLSHQTSSKGVSKTNLHNINYLNYTKTQTNRNKKTGLNTTNNGTKKRTRANIQKEHIIKMIKQKSKNTFDSTSNKVSNNYSKYISNHIHNLKNELIQNKTNYIERPFKKKKNSLQEDKILSLIKTKSKVQKVQKSTSNPKSSRLSKKQPPYPMYIISDVSQLLTENIKFQKGVVIKVENTSGKGKKNQVVVTSTNDSNYHTGALTDETCSNSSQPEYISTKKNNPTLSKHFSIIKLTKTKNNLCNNTNNSKYNNINEHGV